MNPTNSIIAVQDADGAAGLITYWRLSGAVDAQRLLAAWQEQGLDPDYLPTLPSPRAALQRAVAELRDRHVLVRQLSDGAWSLVVEEECQGQLAYSAGATFAVDQAGQLDLSRADFAPAALLDRVRVAYAQHLGQLSHGDIGPWLTDQAARLRGVLLRETGGVWFIPRPAVEEWRRVRAALKASSGCAVYEIPAMRSSEAVAAILDAIQREAEAECAALQEDLSAENPDGTRKFGARALRSRQERCERVESKLASYLEQLQVGALPALQGRIEELRGALATAVLVAEAEAAKEQER